MTVLMKRPVLVTGASSGIGKDITRYLTERGHLVYGTVRKDCDADKLRSAGSVIPLKVDVTCPEQIRAAVNAVTEAGHGLFGLVNNAGIGEIGMLNTWTDDDMFRIFDVNVFGLHRMINAFLPLLLASGGRIINIGSQGGMLTKKYYGPYTMTKHALEAYTQTLREELEPYGVTASVIQPGGIATGIGAAMLPGTIARFERAGAPFREEADMVLHALMNPPEVSDDEEESENARRPSSPEIVSRAVHDALVSPAPKLRYLVGTKWEGDRVIHALIEKLLDENDSPQHNYPRDALVSLLDEHLAYRSSTGET